MLSNCRHVHPRVLAVTCQRNIGISEAVLTVHVRICICIFVDMPGPCSCSESKHTLKLCMCPQVRCKAGPSWSVQHNSADTATSSKHHGCNRWHISNILRPPQASWEQSAIIASFVLTHHNQSQINNCTLQRKAGCAYKHKQA